MMNSILYFKNNDYKIEIIFNIYINKNIYEYLLHFF